MPEMKSPIGSRSYQSHQQRVLEVPDESQHPDYPYAHEPSANPYANQPSVPMANQPTYSPGVQSRHNPMQQANAAPQMPVKSISDEEMAIRQARHEKQHGARITPGAKERLDYLSGVGRVTKDVKVANTTFSLRTLKTRELREVYVTSLNKPPVEQLFWGRSQRLVRAIVAIDGMDFDICAGSNDIETKTEFLDEFDETLIGILDTELTAMEKQAKETFGLKTEADVKEVVDAAKK